MEVSTVSVHDRHLDSKPRETTMLPPSGDQVGSKAPSGPSCSTPSWPTGMRSASKTWRSWLNLPVWWLEHRCHLNARMLKKMPPTHAVSGGTSSRGSRTPEASYLLDLSITMGRSGWEVDLDHDPVAVLGPGEGSDARKLSDAEVLAH